MALLRRHGRPLGDVIEAEVMLEELKEAMHAQGMPNDHPFLLTVAEVIVECKGEKKKKHGCK